MPHRGNWVDRFAPDWLKPYARLARWDRPIGFWLLFWPCGYALALAARRPARGFNWLALIEMFVGAIADAGRRLHPQRHRRRATSTPKSRAPARGRSPPGQVTQAAGGDLPRAAAAGRARRSCCTFNLLTIGLASLSLVLVAIYPFMKRVTWWPQFFLGLAFSWGALVGWTSQTGSLSAAPLVLYLGCIFWVIGYDTIYALQDVEDDSLDRRQIHGAAVRRSVETAVAAFYIAAVVCWLVAAAFIGDVSMFVLTPGGARGPSGLAGRDARADNAAAMRSACSSPTLGRR